MTTDSVKTCPLASSPRTLEREKIIEELHLSAALQSPASPAVLHDGYRRLILGQGTRCLPVASSADVPSPSDLPGPNSWNQPAPTERGDVVKTGLVIQDPRYQENFGLPEGLNCELIPPEEIQSLWNQVVQQSSRQVQKQTSDQQTQSVLEKTKKLELLLTLALNSGDMDLAMLLFSSLESKQANDISKTLLTRMHDLQDQKRQYADNLAGLDAKKPEDMKKANDLNLKITDVGTEIGMLQTFLQEATSQKSEAQQMASNFLKGRHEVGMAIARNIG